MGKIFGLIAVLIALFCVYPPSTHSQTPVPVSTQQNNQNPPKSTQQQPIKNNNISESLKSPFIQVVPQPQNQKTETTRKQEYYWYDTFSDHPTNWLLTLFNFFLVIFAYLLWKATAGLREISDKQWKLSKYQLIYNVRAFRTSEKAAEAATESAKIAGKSLVLTQRAFVYVEDINADKAPFGDPYRKGDCRVTVVLKNSGGTRPENVLCNINSESFPEKPSIKQVFEIPDQGDPIRAVIGPNAPFLSFYKDMPIGMLGVDLLQEKELVYIWGWIDYDDVFDETPRHRTEFCYEIILKGGEGRIGFSLLYQGAENECYHKPSPSLSPDKRKD